MASINANINGVVADFSHDEVNEIVSADDIVATVIGIIGAGLSLVFPGAAFVLAAVAGSIAINRVQFMKTDRGFGVRVIVPWPSIIFGFLNAVSMIPHNPGFNQFLLHTGTPIDQVDAATKYEFAVGDFNRDGIPDLYCLERSNTDNGRLKVRILNGADNYQSFLVDNDTPIDDVDAATNYKFGVGDFNRDGIPDLYCIKRTNTGTNSLEVHILDGATNYQTFLHETGTPIIEADGAANFEFGVGDFNGDGIADLYCLKRSNTDTNRLEVHILSGVKTGERAFQTFLLQISTPIVQDDASANFVFGVGNFNGDGTPDLYCLKRSNTGTNTLEVHILKGNDQYQSFLLQTGTPQDQPGAAALFTFSVGDFNKDSISDIYLLKHTNTGTAKLEVHVLDVAVLDNRSF